MCRGRPFLTLCWPEPPAPPVTPSGGTCPGGGHTRRPLSPCALCTTRRFLSECSGALCACGRPGWLCLQSSTRRETTAGVPPPCPPPSSSPELRQGGAGLNSLADLSVQPLAASATELPAQWVSFPQMPRGWVPRPSCTTLHVPRATGAEPPGWPPGLSCSHQPLSGPRGARLCV